MDGPSFAPGERITHPEFGRALSSTSPDEAICAHFSAAASDGFRWRASERAVSRTRANAAGRRGHARTRPRRAWLSYEAHALPVMESASALTSARIDLLPHQVVLTHRIATASPRRFLIADEVGLGKTIETALILRELASRGELNRALMVVPAGLVNNWHRELNEVFNLDFEVFGSEGDITDRKTNAFAKHDRLIASIDTLKRPARIKRLLDAPRWDLVVFDEAHHLTAYTNRRQGPEDRKLQARRGAEGPYARPAAAFGDAAPRQSFPVLDAGPTAQPDAVRQPGGDGRASAPTEHRDVPPHQGGRVPAGWLAAVRPPLGPHRILRDADERTALLREAARVSGRRFRPRHAARATKGARSAS